MDINKIKVVLFDIDGVLIRLPHYFSRELEKQGYKNAIVNLDNFYNGIFKQQCLVGKVDVNKIIIPYLDRFGWKSTAKKYFNQQFNFEKKYLDYKLISLVKKLQNKGARCYLCTDQDENRAKFLLNKMDFKNIFDGYFISCRIGYRKCDNSFWIHVINKLKKEFSKVKAENIMFFDDNKNNVNVALKFGIHAFLFKNICQLKNIILLSLFK